MPDLPVMLRVADRLCLIVGGGPVALRRAVSLLHCGAVVRVVAPTIEPDLAALDITHLARPYKSGDCHGVCLVVIATDDPNVNEQIAADARAAGALVNRCDDADQGDCSVPAHHHHGPVTIAVHTSGVSAAAAASIRRQLSASLDPAWPDLLQLAAPFRLEARRRIADPGPRRRFLETLASPDLMNAFKSQGPDAARRLLHQWLQEHAAASPRDPRP